MTRAIAALILLTSGAAYAAAGPAKVLLLPFESAGPAEKQWVAKAVQQNLVAELSRVNSVAPVAGNAPASNLDAALKAAADAGADFVVFGSYQAVDADLRMTGQVVDVAKKQAVAGLKTTGSQRDLFGMEDVLTNQVKRALPQPAAEAKPELLKQPAPPAIQPNGPVVMDANRRAQELEDQIDRAINRLRFAPDYGGDYYPSSYFFSGVYAPYYYYPGFAFPHHHARRCFDGNQGLSVTGGFHNRTFSGNFSVGGGTFAGARNHVTSTDGNFASYGRMGVQTPAGRR